MTAVKKCALCGTGPTPRKGAAEVYSTLIARAKEKGKKLKLPDSRFLHVPCAYKILK